MTVATGNPTGRPPVLVIDGMKACAGCGVSHPADAFGVDRNQKCGLNVSCRAHYAQKRKAATPEQKAVRNAQSKAQRDSNLPHRRKIAMASHRRVTYGVSPEVYEQMLADQGGRCAICRRTPAEAQKRELGIDHCHETGKVRGLLCNRCNVGIARLGDNLDGVKRAVTYLEGKAC